MLLSYFLTVFKRDNSQSFHFQVLLTSSPSASSSRQQLVRKRMTEGPVGPSLIRLAVPMIFGLVSIMLFNLVDTFYISQIGARELVAISFTFPVTFTLMSFSFGIGIGAAAVISRAIGEGDQHRVQRLTTDSLLLVALIIICVAGLSFFALDSIFTLMGASTESLPLIKQYMIPWLSGVVFVVIPIVGNSAIRATGDTKTPSWIMIIAAGVNAVLDPLLIFGYGPFPELGIQGAAIATVISYISIMIAGLWVLGIREKMLTTNWPGITEILRSFSILKCGFDSYCSRSWRCDSRSFWGGYTHRIYRYDRINGTFIGTHTFYWTKLWSREFR